MTTFSATTQKVDSALVIEMSGAIDEMVDFTKIPVGDEKKLIIDLNSVTRINSVGIRSWMHWMKSLGTDRNLSFRSCPMCVVSQFNTIGNFLPKGSIVESFYVTYFCESCEADTALLLKACQDFIQGTASTASSYTLPTPPTCNACNIKMDIDISEKIYFRFLNYKP